MLGQPQGPGAMHQPQTQPSPHLHDPAQGNKKDKEKDCIFYLQNQILK